MVRLQQSLLVNGTLRRSPTPEVATVQDYVVWNEQGQEFCTVTLPLADETPVDYITIEYTGKRLEVIGIGANRPVFLMQLTDVAMRQLTTKWLTKI